MSRYVKAVTCQGWDKFLREVFADGYSSVERSNNSRQTLEEAPLPSFLNILVTPRESRDGS